MKYRGWTPPADNRPRTRREKRRRLLIAAVPLLVALQGCSSWRAEHILSQMTRTYAQAKSLEFRSHVIMRVKVSDQTNESERDVYFAFARPNRFREESDSDTGGGVTVSDGNAMLVYSGVLGQYLRRPAPVSLSDSHTAQSPGPHALQLPSVTGSLGYDPISLLDGTELRYKPLSIRFAGEATVDKTPCYHLRIRLRGGANQQLWIDKQRFLIRKSVLWTPTETLRYAGLRQPIPRNEAPEPAGNMTPTIRDSLRDARCTISEEMESVTLNPKLASSTFQYIPPSGAKRVSRFDFGNFVSEREHTGALLNKDAPDFVLSDIHNSAVNLKLYRGRIVVLSFWMPAASETPNQLAALRRLQSRVSAKKVVLLSISPVRDADAVRRVAERYGVDWRVLVDPIGDSIKAYAAKSFPRLIIVDAGGKVIADHQGVTGEEQLAKDLRAAGISLAEEHPAAAPARARL